MIRFPKITPEIIIKNNYSLVEGDLFEDGVRSFINTFRHLTMQLNMYDEIKNASDEAVYKALEQEHSKAFPEVFVGESFVETYSNMTRYFFDGLPHSCLVELEIPVKDIMFRLENGADVHITKPLMRYMLEKSENIDELSRSISYFLTNTYDLEGTKLFLKDYFKEKGLKKSELDEIVTYVESSLENRNVKLKKKPMFSFFKNPIDVLFNRYEGTQISREKKYIYDDIEYADNNEVVDKLQKVIKRAKEVQKVEIEGLEKPGRTPKRNRKNDYIVVLRDDNKNIPVLIDLLNRTQEVFYHVARESETDALVAEPTYYFRVLSFLHDKDPEYFDFLSLSAVEDALKENNSIADGLELPEDTNNLIDFYKKLIELNGHSSSKMNATTRLMNAAVIKMIDYYHDVSYLEMFNETFRKDSRVVYDNKWLGAEDFFIAITNEKSVFSLSLMKRISSDTYKEVDRKVAVYLAENSSHEEKVSIVNDLFDTNFEDISLFHKPERKILNPVNSYDTGNRFASSISTINRRIKLDDYQLVFLEDMEKEQPKRKNIDIER